VNATINFDLGESQVSFNAGFKGKVLVADLMAL